MQSLALDVNVVSEEGQRAEMRDEDDDLLRAAEELGIDLSGVRALAGDGADEQPAEPDAAAESTDDVEAEAEDDAEDTDDGVAVEDLLDGDVTEDIDLDSLAGDESAEELPDSPASESAPR
jgi:DNA-directed RNA polymerase subunit beta